MFGATFHTSFHCLPTTVWTDPTRNFVSDYSLLHRRLDYWKFSAVVAPSLSTYPRWRSLVATFASKTELWLDQRLSGDWSEIALEELPSGSREPAFRLRVTRQSDVSRKRQRDSFFQKFFLVCGKCSNTLCFVVKGCLQGVSKCASRLYSVLGMLVPGASRGGKVAQHMLCDPPQVV